MADAKQLYEFTEAGFFGGRHYAAGARIALWPQQARYDLHRLKLVAEAEASAPVGETAPARKARSSKPAE